METGFMLISPAYAQAAGGGAGAGFEAFLPLILIFVVFYFLLIRPQQKKMKEHREMLNNIRRGDKITTGGGIMGKVTKVGEGDELTVEIAKDVQVKVARSLVSSVETKGQPQDTVKKDADNDSDDDNQSGSGGLKGLLGKGKKD